MSWAVLKRLIIEVASRLKTSRYYIVVYIFDRYGKLLAQLDTNTEWDGALNGKSLPSSDYWFRLEYDEQEAGIIVARCTRANFSLKR